MCYIPDDPPPAHGWMAAFIVAVVLLPLAYLLGWNDAVEKYRPPTEEQRIEQLRREYKPAPHDLSPNDEPQREV